MTQSEIQDPRRWQSQICGTLEASNDIYFIISKGAELQILSDLLTMRLIDGNCETIGMGKRVILSLILCSEY